jgi:hypothetical protein
MLCLFMLVSNCINLNNFNCSKKREYKGKKWDFKFTKS